MKIALAGLVLLVAAVSANATGSNIRDAKPGYRNAPVCPDAEHAEFVGVIDGKATWRCVPN